MLEIIGDKSKGFDQVKTIYVTHDTMFHVGHYIIEQKMAIKQTYILLMFGKI
jgi:hypothetical protein